MATTCRELTVHLVVTGTVTKESKENVYNSFGLTESLVYSLETFQCMHSQTVPCHAMAIALARWTYTLIHELSDSDVTSAPTMAPGV